MLGRALRDNQGTPETMAPENGSGNGAGIETPEYMAAQPKLSKHHSRKSLVSFIMHGQPNMIIATFEKMKKMTWQQKLSMIFVAILWRSGKLLKLLGFIVEWSLNLLHLNNGLLSLLYRFFLFKWGACFISQLPCFGYSFTTMIINFVEFAPIWAKKLRHSSAQRSKN